MRPAVPGPGLQCCTALRKGPLVLTQVRNALLGARGHYQQAFSTEGISAFLMSSQGCQAPPPHQQGLLMSTDKYVHAPCSGTRVLLPPSCSFSSWCTVHGGYWGKATCLCVYMSWSCKELHLSFISHSAAPAGLPTQCSTSEMS